MVRECSLSSWSLFCFSSISIFTVFSFSDVLRLTISFSLWLMSAWQSLSCCFNSEISPVFWHTYIKTENYEDETGKYCHANCKLNI